MNLDNELPPAPSHDMNSLRNSSIFQKSTRNSVDVVLVGGSSRIPRFRRLVKDFFRGQPPSEVLRPDHAAVLGAAVYAAALGHLVGSDSGLERFWGWKWGTWGKMEEIQWCDFVCLFYVLLGKILLRSSESGYAQNYPSNIVFLDIEDSYSPNFDQFCCHDEDPSVFFIDSRRVESVSWEFLVRTQHLILNHGQLPLCCRAIRIHIKKVPKQPKTEAKMTFQWMQRGSCLGRNNPRP